jgi:hypothetical protein
LRFGQRFGGKNETGFILTVHIVGNQDARTLSKGAQCGNNVGLQKIGLKGDLLFLRNIAKSKRENAPQVSLPRDFPVGFKFILSRVLFCDIPSVQRSGKGFFGYGTAT